MMVLGLIAALGRVIQLGGIGEISRLVHILLEVVIESARLLLFLYVLGLADIKNGILRIRNFLRHKSYRRLRSLALIQALKRKGILISLNIVGFSFIAYTINYLISLAAYQTCLLINLKKGRILTESSSEWTIVLFFKNLTVIPFTLVFETLLVLWILNRWPGEQKGYSV